MMDDFEGLSFKAYLIRERGSAGSAVNQYAPFYVWKSLDGMARFLWGGGGFDNIVQSFGRPPVLQWTTAAQVSGTAAGELPTHASLWIRRASSEAEPQGWVAEAERETRDRAASEGVHSVVLGVDPRDWTLVRFTLWREEPDLPEPTYQVLHLLPPSRPTGAGAARMKDRTLAR